MNNTSQKYQWHNMAIYNKYGIIMIQKIIASQAVQMNYTLASDEIEEGLFGIDDDE